MLTKSKVQEKLVKDLKSGKLNKGILKFRKQGLMNFTQAIYDFRKKSRKHGTD